MAAGHLQKASPPLFSLLLNATSIHITPLAFRGFPAKSRDLLELRKECKKQAGTYNQQGQIIYPLLHTQRFLPLALAKTSPRSTYITGTDVTTAKNPFWQTGASFPLYTQIGVEFSFVACLFEHQSVC